MKKAKAFSYSGRLRNIAVLGQVVETKDTSSINHKNIHFRRAVLETSYQTPLPKLLSTRCPKPSLTSSSQAGDLLAYDAVVTKPHWTCSMDGPDRRASRSIWVCRVCTRDRLGAGNTHATSWEHSALKAESSERGSPTYPKSGMVIPWRRVLGGKFNAVVHDYSASEKWSLEADIFDVYEGRISMEDRTMS
ncbi:MAG: hypothetical protein LQ343_002387 [Gyalolechia ehrenbergii]|nr:MAG: hypothetical protein LQ343_002387 [Gyalolechia ehrenbergii]